VIGHLTEAAAATPSELSTIDLVPLGGAIARVASSATAFAGRAAPFLFSASAAWRYPSGDAANIAWSRAVIDRLAGWRFAGTYPNYLPAQDAAGAAELFGSNHARLVALKRRVDPNNVLRSNQNIPPGPGAGGSEGVQSP